MSVSTRQAAELMEDGRKWRRLMKQLSEILSEVFK
jgi:hypothetical protein